MVNYDLSESLVKIRSMYQRSLITGFETLHLILDDVSANGYGNKLKRNAYRLLKDVARDMEHDI